MSWAVRKQLGKIATAILFFASDDASFISGVAAVDGRVPADNSQPNPG